jgi:hypothetical protein
MRQLLNAIHVHGFDSHMQLKLMHEFDYLALFGECNNLFQDLVINMTTKIFQSSLLLKPNLNRNI